MSRYFGLAAAALLSLAGTGGALAADLAVKAPRVVSGCAWCGFYVGGNAGYAWGRDSQSSVFDAPAPFLAVDTAAISASGSPRLKADGFTGGLQAGYNWQSGAVLFGAEADFNAFNLRGSNSGTFVFPSTLPGGAVGPPTAFYTATSSASSDWLFTARNRIGWASDNLLIYGTAGLAVANVKLNQSVVVLGGFTETASVSATQVGWTAGIGAEYMVTRDWSVKGEWLYVDLGKVSATGVLTPAFAGITYNTTAHLTANIARVGVNYHFGGPVVAKY
ncbi:outer membrane protein [Bradyrhizobium sp. McL0616]|uniref:outer membrane protein n=1 Tax=Bradyrhizobium sp. McL0616 TaxID=3415674 RepID=UPI003CF25516